MSDDPTRAGSHGWRGSIVAAVVLAVVLAAIASILLVTLPGSRDDRAPTVLATPPAGSRLPVRDFSHVYVIVLENKDVERIRGDDDAPYLNDLIRRYGSADAYQAVARPSQPNYLALISGSTHGVADNEDHDIDAPTVLDQIEAAGRTWQIAAENLPGDCFTGARASGGRDGDGEYARKHEPAISFTSIRSDPERCARITDLTGFDPAAPADLTIIVPNLCHDMHDCSVAKGDGWLRAFVPTILESDGYRNGGLLVITFDENDTSTDPANRVVTVVINEDLAIERSDTPHNHYSLLRTIQDAWGLDCLAESCSANTLGEFFR